MEFNSTNLPQNVSKGLLEQFNYDFAPMYVEKLYDVLFYSAAYVLKELKDKNAPVAYVISDVKKNEIAAAMVEYHEGEDDNPGNWSLIWTFNVAEDVPANALKIYLDDVKTHKHFKTVAGTRQRFQYSNVEALVNLNTYIISELYKWLDENANEKEAVEIVLDNVFTAKVQIEDGKKNFAIIPAGEVKTIIKDDVAIEK